METFHVRVVFDSAQEISAIRKNFKAIDGFFDECLVCAISLKYLDNGDAKRAGIQRNVMLDEYKSGFYEQLGEHEKSRRSLREYYPEMLQHLDVEKELRRWKSRG